MRHRHGHRILGRTAPHRNSLVRNLTSDLLKHGSLITTQARAQEVRRHIERLITRAKGELTLHRRRQLLAVLASQQDLDTLREIAAQHQSRPGGYTRLTKLPTKRHDAATMVRLDFVEETSKS